MQNIWRVVVIVSLGLFVGVAMAEEAPDEGAGDADKTVCGDGLIRVYCGGQFHCAIPPAPCCHGVVCGDGGSCTGNPASPCRWGKEDEKEDDGAE